MGQKMIQDIQKELGLSEDAVAALRALRDMPGYDENIVSSEIVDTAQYLLATFSGQERYSVAAVNALELHTLFYGTESDCISEAIRLKAGQVRDRTEKGCRLRDFDIVVRPA